MKYQITEKDKELILQPSVDYKYRVKILDKQKNVLDEVSGISSVGSYDIDSESDTRRVTSLTILLDENYSMIEDRIFSWIGYDFLLSIGIFDIITDDYIWYDCGYYLITESNTSYSASDNTLNLNLSDWYSKLDGTRNGQIGGAPTISIPNTCEVVYAFYKNGKFYEDAKKETEITDASPEKIYLNLLDVTPVMTGETTSGVKITDSGHYSDNNDYRIYHAFSDDNKFYKSKKDNLPITLKIDFGEDNSTFLLNGYSIEVNDLTQSPNSWTFSFSDDDNIWKTCDQVAAKTWNENEIYLRGFKLSEPHRYYKFVISDSNDSDNNYVTIKKIKLYSGETAYRYFLDDKNENNYIVFSENYDDDSDNKVTLKETVENIIKAETDFQDYEVSDIGEFKGMPWFNENYLSYREFNPLWNQLPYDLEYSVGANISEIFDEVKNLYPSCEMYFDTYGYFCFASIPSMDLDPVVLNNDYLQQILLAESSESVSYDISAIKNVTEVWGKAYDVDRFSESPSTKDNTYRFELEEYDAYETGYIAVTMPNTLIEEIKTEGVDPEDQHLWFQIHNGDAFELAKLPIIKEYTYDPNNTPPYEYVTPKYKVHNYETGEDDEVNTFKPGQTYVFQIKKAGKEFVAYYLGQYQPHAICVLSNKADATLMLNGRELSLKDYFSQQYNCDKANISIRVEPDSPFTIQKLGIILDVKTGDNFDSIESDTIAIENSIAYNKNSTSVWDTVTLSTKMIPFLDVNQKVSYKKQQDDEEHQYVIKSISNDTSSCTSSITLYRFSALANTLA